MDYPCAKFGDCSFSRFGSIVRTNRHTDAQTDADERFTLATVVGVSNYLLLSSDLITVATQDVSIQVHNHETYNVHCKARFPLPELTARVNG